MLAVFYLAYSFIQLRNDLFTVYDVPEKYTYKTSPTADLMVVDFNKYGCTHCQALHPVLLEAIRRDGNIIYIPRTVTFADDWSGVITSAVYAAAEQGKFIEMFNAVYDHWPIDDEETLLKRAKDIGLDTHKLGRDMNDPNVMEWVKKNDMHFETWGFNSIPTLLIGKNQIYKQGEQTPTVAEILEKFAEARAKWL